MRGTTVAPDHDGVTPRPRLLQRQRAPTITIDTSATSLLDNHTGAPYGESLSPGNSPTPTQRQRSLSIESTEHTPLLSQRPRPATPGYLSLNSKGDDRPLDPHNLLAVPSIGSRGSSLDHHSLSSYSGESLFSTLTVSEYGGSHRKPTEPVSFHALGHEHPLPPDRKGEHELHAEDSPFAFSPAQLSDLFDPKDLAAFWALGGLQGLVLGLRTDCASGLSLDETGLDGTVELDYAPEITGPTSAGEGNASLDGLVRMVAATPIRHTSSEPYVDRKRVFGISRLPERKSKTLLQIMWVTFNDNVLIILTVVAAISLALGLYQDFGQSHRYGGPKVRWVEGVTIIVAVSIVVVVGSLNDYQKEKQFAKLNRKKADRTVKVIRSGKSQQISIYNILAGDVLHLEPGDLVPADGVLISGHNIRCDESSVTGESDQKKKIPGGKATSQIAAGASVDKIDPFIISGSKVLEGTGTYLVTGVGLNSSYGKLLMAVTDDSETTATPLQMRLGIMAEQITKLGCAVALFLFVVLFAKFLFQLRANPDSAVEKAQDFFQLVIVTMTIIVIAVPEGLPLAVTLALAFAMARMLKDQNLVRVLSSCETMGNATAICTDKTGTLTTNNMTVVAGLLGTCCLFGTQRGDSRDESNGDQTASDNNTPVSLRELASQLSPEVRDLLSQSIAINSTAFEGDDGQPTFIGSKTETALLSFAKDYLGLGSLSEERANASIVEVFPFDSGRKCMATVVRLFDGTFRMYVKGASEILLDRCTQIITDISGPLTVTALTEDSNTSLIDTINKYGSRSLRTVSIVYRDFESWPPYQARTLEGSPEQVEFEGIFEEMVFLGVVGIQDPLRPDVKNAIKQCQQAGVFLRMVTGDNKRTAEAIARECGIYTEGGIILEGPEFRKLSQAQMDRVLPKLQVLARSSPEDKRILVKRLKELGDIVAVTGDGTNDGPALRAADVGFSMGVSGTEVAREASSIILMDDNFSSIIKALEWGRAVNDSVRKFLQFQLTVNITAVGITFVSAVANPNEEPILTPVQLLWVNLIMDTFAALALATDPPSPSILDRKPDSRSARLITLSMWKMIIGQAIYQLVVTLVLNFAGNEILGYKSEFEKSRLETLIFNTFVWMQIFNQLNNRRLDNKLNIFEGISRNWFFIGINIVTICGQVIIVFVGSSALSTVRLNMTQWGISLVLGAMSMPIAVLIRLIPDEFILKFLPRSWGESQTPGPWISSNDIREQFSFFKMSRGRRFDSLYRRRLPKLVLSSNRDAILGAPGSQINGGTNSRDCSMTDSALIPAVVMAGVVAGSIAGWSPIERVDDDDGLPPPVQISGFEN